MHNLAENLKTNEMKISEIKTGDRFQTFFSNGKKSNIIIVVRITEKSIYWKADFFSEDDRPIRKSHNSFEDLVNLGFYKKIN